MKVEIELPERYFKQCPFCAPVKEAFERAQKLLNCSVELSNGLEAVSGLRVACIACGDLGFVLTADGLQLRLVLLEAEERLVAELDRRLERVEKFCHEINATAATRSCVYYPDVE